MRILKGFSKTLFEFLLSRDGQSWMDIGCFSRTGGCAEFAYPQLFVLIATYIRRCVGDTGELSCGRAFKLMQAAMLSDSCRQSTESFLSSLDLAMVTQCAT